METVLPAGAYADSIDSLSPRSRGAESWDEPFAPAPAAKLRLMCSYGGQIVPCPHNRTLCYLGGETRLLVVDRHTTLSNFHARLSSTLLDGRLFSLKYQLPSEDLDSLISLSTDEDLENVLEEYDRLATSSSFSCSGRSFRLRLFLFPAKPDPPSTTTMGSLLDDSKSETWFVDALNSAMLGPDSASSSVNCLLNLDDSKPSPDGTGMPAEGENDLGFPALNQQALCLLGFFFFGGGGVGYSHVSMFVVMIMIANLVLLLMRNLLINLTSPDFEDHAGHIVVGTSTNGATFKIPGLGYYQNSGFRVVYMHNEEHADGFLASQRLAFSDTLKILDYRCRTVDGSAAVFLKIP